MPGRSRLSKLLKLLCAACSVFALFAIQGACAQAMPGTSVKDLPRPGYEPRTIRLGALVLAPEAALGVSSVSNVFATHLHPKDDVYLSLAPSLTASANLGRLSLRGQAFGQFNRYNRFTTEDVDVYGGNAKFGYTMGRANSASGQIGYEHTYQRRDDPEAVGGIRPALYNQYTAQFGYQYRPGRMGITAGFQGSRARYLNPKDSDRDLTSMSWSVRGLLGLSPHLDSFIEAFANRRNFRLNPSGLDRDSTTAGVNIGVTVSVTNLITGELGFGYFNNMPDSSSRRSFSGLGVSGSLQWRPRVRTLITGSVFRGDVATVQSGAYGRIDTDGLVAIQQEARHNLLLSASAEVQDTSYRGTNLTKTTIALKAGGEYLINRHFGLSVDLIKKWRDSNSPASRFEDLSAHVSLTWHY